MRQYKQSAYVNQTIEREWDKKAKDEARKLGNMPKPYPARRGNNKMLRRLLKNQYRAAVRANRMKAIRGMAARHHA